VGAKAMGLGEAFTAVADDASAIYWNPAGLARFEKHQVQFSHYDWYQDVKIENLYFTMPSGRFGFGAGITYLGFGAFQSYDEDGNPGDELTMYNLSAAVSVGYALSENFSVGMTGKYIEQSFDIVKGTAFAGDIGLLANFNSVRFGLAVVNLGTPVRFVSQEEQLPSAIRVGMAVRQFSEKMMVSVEAYVPREGDIVWHQGLELNMAGQLYARTGFTYQSQDVPETDAFRYNLGAGIAYGAGRFDYTFIPSSQFGGDPIHNLSLSLTW
ncbi:MAG: PorV/PorQ family protein, partial [candidate division Zixibacteria bacterium]|nr:PorV/PorQ family protein [candidate division Zixibacteria bacterium]